MIRKVLILVLLGALALPLSAAEKQKDLTFFAFERVFPHVAFGGVWSSTIILMNLYDVETDTTIRFFRPDGTPWEVTDAEGNTYSTRDITFGPWEMLVIELPSTGQDVETGWAEVDQPENASIGGQLIFRDNGGVGRPIPFEAVVPLTDFIEGAEALDGLLWVMHAPFDQRAGFNTCLAIANPDEEELEVAFVPVDIEEGIIGEAVTSILLPARNQRAFCLNTELPDLAGRRGYLTLGRSLGTAVGVLGLRFNAQGAFTTFFPMSTL